MLLTYPRMLKITLKYLPTASNEVILNKELDKLFLRYTPDYQGSTIKAIRDLNNFEYDPVLDTFYCPDENRRDGIFGAIYQIIQRDLTISNAVNTDTSNPLIVAYDIDQMRFSNFKRRLTRNIPNTIKAPATYNNICAVRYNAKQELNKLTQNKKG